MVMRSARSKRERDDRARHALPLIARRSPDQLQQQRPLRMQPVLRLVHHRGGRSVEHGVVDLDVAAHRQAVHDDPLAAARGAEPRPVSRQSRSPARSAASSSGVAEVLHRAPRLHVDRVGADERRRPGRSLMWTDAAPLPRRAGGSAPCPRGRARSRRGRAMTISMPRCAAAMAALAGTAVGSALGCQAHISTKRLPRGSPELLRAASCASASPWQGWRRADSRLITGFSQYWAKLRMIAVLPHRRPSRRPRGNDAHAEHVGVAAEHARGVDDVLDRGRRPSRRRARSRATSCPCPARARSRARRGGTSRPRSWRGCAGSGP